MSEHRAAGFLNVNKPLHLTSHDVVAQTRRHYRRLTGSRKVGHAGTLDPLAEGVLVICLGAATRLSDYVMRSRKIYRAEITLGVTTASYDAAGGVLSRRCPDHITRADIERALPRFVGDIEQIPPMFSAVKVDGVKLYELARRGETVQREPRSVSVYSIEILAWRNPVVEIEVACGAGTYIRSLAHDLGAALGVGACLSGLTRVASGAFTLRDSLPLDAIEGSGDWLRRVISPYEALTAYPRVRLDDEEIARLRQGRFISRPPECDAETVFAFDGGRRLVAILEPRAQLWKPRKVFADGSI